MQERRKRIPRVAKRRDMSETKLEFFKNLFVVVGHKTMAIVLFMHCSVKTKSPQIIFVHGRLAQPVGNWTIFLAPNGEREASLRR